MPFVPWTPVDEPTLYGWIDASDSDQISQSGGAVASYADKAGNGLNYIASGSKSPTIAGSDLNGLDTFDFDGIDDVLVSDASDAPLTSISVFVVYRPESNSARQGIINKRHQTDTSYSGFEFRFGIKEVSSGATGIDAALYGTSGSISIGATVAAPLDEWEIALVTIESGTEALYFDGEQDKVEAGTLSGVGQSKNSGNRWFIGASQDGTRLLNGKIAEILVFNDIPDNALREKVEGYMAHKWGLEGNLPAAHPYKSQAPGEEVGGESYGQTTGTVLVNAVAAERDLVAITYAKQEVDDGNGGTIETRQVVGETRSAPDGSYTLQMPNFIDEVIVLALEDYGEVWRPNRSYAVGERLRPTVGNETGHVYIVTIAGVSDATEPTWIVPAGGSDTMAVGTATVQAVPAWWSVAHAPIMPIQVIPLSITEQPANISVASGEVASFTISAESSEAISYQWYSAATDTALTDGGAIAGATTAELEITTTGGDNGSTYYCIAGDPDETVQSDTVTLTVT